MSLQLPVLLPAQESVGQQGGPGFVPNVHRPVVPKPPESFHRRFAGRIPPGDEPATLGIGEVVGSLEKAAEPCPAAGADVVPAFFFVDQGGLVGEAGDLDLEVGQSGMAVDLRHGVCVLC